MPYRPYPSAPSREELRQLVEELPQDHLARLVEQVVEAVVLPPQRPPVRGNVPYDPRVPLKVLIYGYVTGTRSSRQLQRLCHENVAYLWLTRGQAPCYHTFTSVRTQEKERLEEIWVSLFALAEELGLKRLGHVVVDSSKFRAHASPEAVVTREQYAALRQELEQILATAEIVDAREDAEGYPGETRVGRRVERPQMRQIVRGVRRHLAQAKAIAERTVQAALHDEETPPSSSPAVEPSPTGRSGATTDGERTTAAPAAPGPAAGEPVAAEPVRLTRRMLARVQAALAALGQAMAEGWDYLCLTDPDARMMAEGRDKKIRMCHSYEAATDNGLLVVGQTSQASTDNDRLEPILAAAERHEPEGVKKATADSGFYAGDAVGRQIRRGVDTCIPDSNTAADLHRGEPIGTRRAKTQGSVAFVYEEAADLFRCPEGNELRRLQEREHGGQQVTVYRAKQPCVGCPRAGECLTQKNAKHRTVKVGAYEAELEAARQRFAEPSHQERYRHRGEQIETVFGVFRGTLGYTRFLLRGEEGVAREGQLFTLAYQLRKLHGAWAPRQRTEA
jgi:transposase